MSYDFSYSQTAFLAQQRAAFFALRPTSFMVITGITDGGGPPRGFNIGRLHSRYALGAREADRDRRRHR